MPDQPRNVTAAFLAALGRLEGSHILAEKSGTNVFHFSNTDPYAAAVVIAPAELTNIVPVQRKGADAEMVTQFEMHGVEDLGLLKMDFLGLSTLSIIERCLDLVERTTGERPDIDDVPLDDGPTFELLKAGNTIGSMVRRRNGRKGRVRSSKACGLPSGSSPPLRMQTLLYNPRSASEKPVMRAGCVLSART